MINQETIRYLINFVANATTSAGTALPAHRWIGYTDDPEQMKRYLLVILPSGFFDINKYGTEEFFPTFPLKKWHEIPILYGQGDEKAEYADTFPSDNESGPIIIHADLIASAYFLVSRYEEIFKRKIRDEFGRFPGKESVPFKGNFIHRPVIDEYGRELRHLLRKAGLALRKEEEQPHAFSHIYLAHNIISPFCMTPWAERIMHWRLKVMWLLRRFAIKLKIRFNTNEINQTKFLDWDKSVERAYPEGIVRSLFFMLTPGHRNDGKRIYHLTSFTIHLLRRAMNRYGVLPALSCNRECNLEPEESIIKARRLLHQQFGQWVSVAGFARLCAREPEDFIATFNAGIRHDFSMGYFDVPGFRLGTARPVQFINPSFGKLTELVMHPLTIVDTSLSDKEGMRMTYEEALGYAQGLVKKTAEVHGELTLMWNSDLLNKENHEYHSRLYRDLLRLVIDLEHKKNDIYQAAYQSQYS